MTRLLSMLLLAATLRGCVTYEFDQEFWLKTDGSGSFTVTAPLWVWNAVKNVGQATDLDATVNEETVGAVFQDAAILKPRVKKTTQNGHPYITVSGDFTNVNSLVGTRAFPDLVIALQPESDHLRLFGVWRRPAFSGTGQGDESGLMAVRFHIPSEIQAHRNASNGIERGNILSWQQDLRGGIAGAPIDFGATIGTRRLLSATLGPLGLAVVFGVGSIAVAVALFQLGRRGPKRRRGHPPGAGGPTADDSNFLNYDPGAK